MEEPLTVRHLFGGAVDLAMPAARFVDVSDHRPVPDHQEVFSDASLDQSLIVEFVEHLEVADAECGEAFFCDLADGMDAAHRHITSITPLRSDSVPGLPEGTCCVLVSGQVTASKGRQGAEALNKVQVHLLVVRLPRHGTDLLVTLNTPIFIHESSAAAAQAEAGFKDAGGAIYMFRRVIASLAVRDWGLFGGGGGDEP